MPRHIHKENTMEDIIASTKAELIRAKDQMTHTLATTPDDKLNWAPSSTARTPIQQVAHGANAISGIQGMLAGKPFPFSSIGEFDAAMRADEKEYTTRDQVLSLLEQNSADYLAWLDTLTSEQLASMVQLPFGPAMPTSVCITFAADHLRQHVAQMGYIQTIYGDLDWHMEN